MQMLTARSRIFSGFSGAVAGRRNRGGRFKGKERGIMVERAAVIDKILEYKDLYRNLNWFRSYYSEARLAEMAQRQRDIEPEARAQAIAYWEEAVRLAAGEEYISLVGQPNELMRISTAEGLRRAMEGEIETVYPEVCLPKKRTGRTYNDGSPEYSNVPARADSCRAVAKCHDMGLRCWNCGEPQYDSDSILWGCAVQG